MKYMVMECHLSYAVVLSEDGRFIKVANRNYETGQTVTDIVEMQLPATRKTVKWFKPLIAVAACFAIMATALLYTANSTYASVYMAINPQVRIDVNRSDKVVAVEGVNADGALLVQQYSHGRKQLPQVMDELVDLAIDMGYLHEGGKIAITLEADSIGWVDSHSTSLSQQLDSHLKEKLSVTVEVRGGSSHQSQIIIPTNPEYSDYGDTDYGDSDYGTAEGESDYSDYGTAEGESVYYGGATDYGDSDYGSSAADSEAESDYETEDVSDYETHGDSDYDD